VIWIFISDNKIKTFGRPSSPTAPTASQILATRHSSRFLVTSSSRRKMVLAFWTLIINDAAYLSSFIIIEEAHFQSNYVFNTKSHVCFPIIHIYLHFTRYPLFIQLIFDFYRLKKLTICLIASIHEKLSISDS
jgi:hypothetical protein